MSLNAICAAIHRMMICKYQEAQLKYSFFFFLNVKNIFMGVRGNKRTIPSFKSEVTQQYMLIFINNAVK